MSKVHQIEFDNLRESSLLSEKEIDEVSSSLGNSSNLSEEEQELNKKTYDHTDQFAILYGGKWKYLPCIFITTYLLGTCTSKCIMTAKTLTKVF